jgi:hypothetical protein
MPFLQSFLDLKDNKLLVFERQQIACIQIFHFSINYTEQNAYFFLQGKYTQKPKLSMKFFCIVARYLNCHSGPATPMMSTFPGCFSSLAL